MAKFVYNKETKVLHGWNPVFRSVDKRFQVVDAADEQSALQLLGVVADNQAEQEVVAEQAVEQVAEQDVFGVADFVEDEDESLIAPPKKRTRKKVE